MLDAFKKFRAPRDAVASSFAVLDALREATAEKKAEIARIERAPVPVAEAMTAIEDWMAEAATAAVDGLSLRALLEPGRAAEGIRLPVAFSHVDGKATIPDASPAVAALLGLFIATNGPALRKVLAAQLADLSEIRGEAIPAAERAARIEAARAELLEAELLEEAATRQIEAAGLDVARRPDADPRALLCADACLPS